MAPNLAIAIVPGSFSPASLYSTAVVKLKAAGFSTVKVLQYPSIGLGDGNQGVTMADDAQYLHSELEKLLDAGHDVVVNAHSYGGMPASESLKGLSKKQRAADGKKGGVVGMIYTAAIVPRPGQSSNDVMGGGTDVPVTPFIQIHGDYMTLEPVENAKLNFSDMPFEEAVEWAKKASGQSTASFADPLTYPGYKDVPVAYVFTEKDTTVWPEMQRAQIENIEQERGSKITVYPIATGHFPYISYPDIMVDAIEKATAEIERP